MRQGSRPAVPDNPAMVENLLELGRSVLALSGFQICFAPNVGGVEAGKVGDERNCPQLDRGSSLQGAQGGSRVLFVQCHLRLNRWQPKRLHLRVQWIAFSQVLRQRLGSCPLHPPGKTGWGLPSTALLPG